MQHKNMLKVLAVNALLLGVLLTTPTIAHAEGAGGGIIIAFDIVDTSVYSERTDDDLIADESNGEEEANEDAAAGSAGQSEYKYISIRRF